MKSTKKAFVLSLLSMLLCVSMLIGTTFAWFTDTATSTNNRIVAGNLKVDLLMYKGTEYTSIAGGSGDIFREAGNANNTSASLWEPGKTQVAYLAVKNAGSLALKYNILLDVKDEDTTDTVNLADVLDFAIIDGVTNETTYTNWADVKALANVQTGNIGEAMKLANPQDDGSTPAAARVLAAPNGKILAADSTGAALTEDAEARYNYFVLAVHMKEEAGNEYQGKSIVIDISIVATQLNAESDSFGPDYDEQATYPVVNIARTTITSTTSEDLTVESTGAVESATVSAGAANAVFNEMKDNDAESNELTLTLNVTKTGEATTDAGTTVALEIDMTVTLR